MEKRTGWRIEYPEDLRNGEWEYARFLPDGRRDPTADIKGCFVCHKPKAKRILCSRGLIKFLNN
jgi:hypothetical protein